MLRQCICLSIACLLVATVPFRQNWHSVVRKKRDVSNALEWDVLFPLPASARIRLANELGGYDTSPISEWRALRTTGGRSYPSELADGGYVTWQKASAGADGVVHVDVSAVRSDFLEAALGIGVTAYVSGWAITTLTVPRSGTYLVSCGAVNRFRVGEDGPFFQGDYYAWYPSWGVNAWVKWPVRLDAGEHTLLVQLRRSAFSCSVEPLDDDKSEAPAVLAPGTHGGVWNPAVYAPSVHEGRLVSPFLGIPLLNTSPRRGSLVEVALSPPLRAAVRGARLVEPGQAVQPVVEVLQHDHESFHLDCQGGKARLNVTFVYERSGDGIPAANDSAGDRDSSPHHHHLVVAIELPCWAGHGSGDALQFTFLDADGSVQVAAAIPPVDGDGPATCPEAGCPVVLATHGAGVDATSGAWTGAFKAVRNAWMLFPSNRAEFGYDWEGLGLQNALSALRGLAAYRPGAPRGLGMSGTAVTVDLHSLLLTGHSMGGHGCLVLATHLADRALGAACAAGWIRFDHYVQEWSSVESSFADATLLSLLSSSAAAYHTDALAPHLKGLPFVARMGGSDDNVHPWNLRRFARIVDQVNGRPGWARILEAPGQGHWFDGVMSSPEMAEFFDRALREGKPPLPDAWRVKSLGGWNEGRGGVRILQHATPFTAAWIDVAVDRRGGRSSWRLRTHNVRRFALCKTPGIKAVGRATRVVVDDAELEPRLWSFCFPEERPGASQPAAPAPETAATVVLAKVDTDLRRRQLRHGASLHSQPLRGVFGEGADAADAGSDDEGAPLPGHYFRDGGEFVASDDEDWMLDERSAANSGPLAQIVEGAITFVCGTRGSADHAAAVRAWALLAANTLFSRGRVDASIVTDDELLQDADLRARASSSRLVLLGGPTENAATAALLERSTFETSRISFGGERRRRSNSQDLQPSEESRWRQALVNHAGEEVQKRPDSSSAGFSVGELHFEEPGVGIIALGQVWCADATGERELGPELSGLQKRCRRGEGAEGTLVAIVAGTDVAGFERAARLFPSEPNAQVPDWAVVGPELDWQAAGGVVATGFYDHAWRLLPGMSYPRV